MDMKFLKLILLAEVYFFVLGCGHDDKLVSTSYGTAGGGIVNDSMALFLLRVTDTYDCYKFAGACEFYEQRECYLTLADIRKDKIYMQKEISPIQDCHNIKFFMLDSILFFIKESNYSNNEITYSIGEITSWKLKDDKIQQVKQVEPKFKKLELKGKGWKDPYDVRIRSWQNGLILANSRYGINRYALLDTVAGTMERWEPSGEFEWLNDCIDAKWSSAGGLCLKEIPDTTGFILLKNGIDTLAIRYIPYKANIRDNPKESLIFSGNGIISRGWIYLMNGQVQVSEKSLNVLMGYRAGTYYDLYGNIMVNYFKTIVY